MGINEKKVDNSPLAGFSFIEICMVLVIAGLIATAGIKGLDLVRSAQATKVVTWVRGWEQSMYAFLERKGSYAGDPDQNGEIDAAAVDELQGAKLQDQPTETLLFSSTKFVMRIGSNGGSNPNNLLLVTKADPTAVFSEIDVLAAEKIDIEIDGAAGADRGAVRGYDGVSLSGDGVVTGVGAVVESFEDAVGVAYYFDGTPASETGSDQKTSLGSTFEEISSAMIDLLRATPGAKTWGDERYTDIGLDPEEWKQPYDGILYTPHGEFLKVEPADGYFFFMTAQSGEELELTDRSNWVLWCSIDDETWYYHEKESGKKVDITTLTVQANND